MQWDAGRHQLAHGGCPQSVRGQDGDSRALVIRESRAERGDVRVGIRGGHGCNLLAPDGSAATGVPLLDELKDWSAEEAARNPLPASELVTSAYIE